MTYSSQHNISFRHFKVVTFNFIVVTFRMAAWPINRGGRLILGCYIHFRLYTRRWWRTQGKYERSNILTAEKDMKAWLTIAVIHNLSSCDSGFEPMTSTIPVHCFTYSEFFTLWVCNIPVNDEECYWIYLKVIYLNCWERYEDMIDHRYTQRKQLWF